MSQIKYALFLLLSVFKDTLLWFNIMDNNQTRQNNFCLSTIYMGKPVSSRFGRMIRTRLVNFDSESRLPFVQTSSTYRKTASKARNWNNLSANTGLPFRCSVAPGNFPTTRKAVFTFRPDFLETFRQW